MWAWSTEKSWGLESCSFSWRICSHTVSLRFNFDDVSFFLDMFFFPVFFVFRLDSFGVIFFTLCTVVTCQFDLSTLTQDADVAWYLAADTTEVLTGGLPWPKRPSKIEVHIGVSKNRGKTHYFRKHPDSVFLSPSFCGRLMLRHIHLMIIYHPCWVMATQIFFIFILTPGEMIIFWTNIFQTMWNHQLDIRVYTYISFEGFGGFSLNLATHRHWWHDTLTANFNR